MVSDKQQSWHTHTDQRLARVSSVFDPSRTFPTLFDPTRSSPRPLFPPPRAVPYARVPPRPNDTDNLSIGPHVVRENKDGASACHELSSHIGGKSCVNMLSVVQFALAIWATRSGESAAHERVKTVPESHAFHEP
jgi:hypothetical protein